jgi:hypothetical protein
MMQDVIDELRKFADDLTEWYPPAKRKDIEELEQSLDVKLPDDYKEFLMETNGFQMMGQDIFGIKNRQFDLYEAYRIEHNEVYVKMPHHLIPICPDGYGNHYCFDNSNDNVVVFWEFDLAAYYQDRQEVYEPEVVYPDFKSMVQELLIDWTLEDYNYDGSEK